MHVLIAEDDETLGDGLGRYLRQAGHQVDLATNGREADLMLTHEWYDLLVLDIGLPGLDGFEVLRRARLRDRYVPTIVLTARDAVEDRVRGLDLGADDYLIKPFSLLELEARMRSVLRRNQKTAETHILYAKLKVDIAARRAWVENDPLRLTSREWGVLECLVLRAGKMVSKDQIAAAISDLDAGLNPNVIEVYISRLRQKLAASGVKIHSIRGFGYYLEKTADDEH
jgi:two-component system, OmpR family, response regulator